MAHWYPLMVKSDRQLVSGLPVLAFYNLTAAAATDFLLGKSTSHFEQIRRTHLFQFAPATQ